MPASFSTGRSQEQQTSVAAQAAATEARSGLRGAPARLVLVFAGPKHDLSEALATTTRLFPDANVAGCSTAGEFTGEGLTHNGLVVAALASADLQLLSTMAETVGKDPLQAAETLTTGFAAALAAARQAGLPFSAVLTLVDGLNGKGERLVNAIAERADNGARILGGAAGDEGTFKQTRVGLDGRVAADAAVGISIFGRNPIGIGMRHGLTPSTKRMPVSRADGNIIYEIDGRPAFEIYRDHAHANGVELTPQNAGPYMITYELGIYLFGELWEARAPLSVNPDGSLMCAGDLSRGQQVCILEGAPAPMIAAAREAAREAREGLRGAKPAGVLVFDCICRGILLKEAFDQEIAAIRNEIGDVPIAGFLTYGEIARYGGSSNGWHNTTAVVVAIPA